MHSHLNLETVRCVHIPPGSVPTLMLESEFALPASLEAKAHLLGYLVRFPYE